MKKLMIVLFSLGLAIGASAQRGHGGGGFHGGGYSFRPRVGIGVGFYSPFYSPFGLYGGYGLNPYWGFPYGGYGPNYGYARMQASKLQRKVQDIKSDYADRIYSAKHDESLTRKQRRQAVRSLKHARDQEVQDTVASYHRRPMYQGQNQQNQQNQNQPNQNQQNQPNQNQTQPNQNQNDNQNQNPNQ